MQPIMPSVFLVVLAATLLRLIFAASTGLGIDESYMVAAAHQFDASYFDHPLASWWLELSSRFIFGSAAPIVVRLPFILLSALSSSLIYFITARLFTKKAAFWAVVGYTISPVFSLAFGCWVLPDGPLDTALLGLVYCLIRALCLSDKNSAAQPLWWWGVGICGGLAMLSKYSAALVMAGAVFAILSDTRSRQSLKHIGPYGAAILAILLFSPIIFWNAQHGWQSFSFQGARATGFRFQPLAPFSILGGEALYILPWLWVPMMALLFQGLLRGPRDRARWLLCLMALPPIALFALIGLWSSTRILYHWATPGYLMLFPLLGAWAAQFTARTRNLTAGISATLLAGAALLVSAEIQFGIIPALDTMFPLGHSPLIQAIDWRSIQQDVPARTKAIACLRWFDAGKIGYALRDRNIIVTVLGDEPHEFGITAPPASLLGQDVLLIASPGDPALIQQNYAPYFRTLAPGPTLTIKHDGVTLQRLPTIIGSDLLTVPPN